MAKKKSGFGLGKILSAVAVVLGLVAVIMLFVQAVKVPDTKTALGTIESDAGYTGLQIAFGTSENDVKVLSFSFMALLPVLLAVVGMVISALQVAAKKGSKVLDIVAVCCFVVAGVLYFIMPSFMVFADTLAGAVVEKVEFALSFGSIIAAICTLLAGVATVAKVVLKK